MQMAYVLQEIEFMDKVVSHLCRTNKKESFERQLNLYGIKKDLSTGNYVHQNLFKGASQAQLALPCLGSARGSGQL